MKVMMMAVGAFVIGLGGSTAAVFMTAPVKPAPAATATATHGAAVPGAGTHAGGAAVPGAGTHAGGAADSIHRASATPPVTAPQPAAEASIAHNGSDPTLADAQSGLTSLSGTTRLAATESPAGYRQVARVLSSMKPTDAAKIAAYLTDDQVEGIIGQLGVRQAASLLTQLPTERAAALSKRIMKNTEAK